MSWLTQLIQNLRGLPRELMYVFDRSGRAHENDHTNVGDELGEINNIRNAQFIKQTCGKCPIVKLAF